MDAVAGMDEEGFRARPEQGAWNVAEVLAHLLAAETMYMRWVEAGEIVLAQPNALDEDTRRLAQRMSVPQVLHGLAAQRRSTLQLLERLPPETLARPLRYEKPEQVPASWLFQKSAVHEEEHAGQIRTLRGQPAAAP